MGQDSQSVWGSSVTTRVVVRRKLRAARCAPFFRGSWIFPHRRLASLSFLRQTALTILEGAPHEKLAVGKMD